ncbi:hypothetical protein EON65_41920 [archaeon]|nr:MAG: hypothetical protein EON65_41920 [archaeon]
MCVFLLGILFSHRAFDDLFSEDSDIERLKHLPGVKEQIDSFRQAFKNLSEEFIKNSLEKYEKRKKEVYDFERAVKGVRSHDDYESTQLIDGFNKSKKMVSDQITSSYSVSHAESVRLVKGLQEELDKVGDYDLPFAAISIGFCVCIWVSCILVPVLLSIPILPVIYLFIRVLFTRFVTS